MSDPAGRGSAKRGPAKRGPARRGPSDALVQSAAAGFREQYGHDPLWIALAPGRVNLIGDHTDYSGGLALPFAVDLYTVVCAAPAQGPLRIASARQPGIVSIATPESPTGTWVDYVLGVMAGYRERGVALPGLDVFVDGDLPLGAGLSSSAALELAVAAVVEEVTACPLSLEERALLCQRAEHEWAGVPCGILDQFSIAFAQQGHLLRLDCRDQHVDRIPCPVELEFLVVDSGVRHDLSDGGYADRRCSVERAENALGLSLRNAELGAVNALPDPDLRSRARHVVTENARVNALVDAVRRGDIESAGEIMVASHRSLADDFAVSVPAMDHLVDRALDAGALGARMTGGGFGGSVICLLRPGNSDAVAGAMLEGYRERFGCEATTRRVRPVDGVRLVQTGA